MPIPKGPKGVEKVMHEFKHGELHSGSKKGPLVRSHKQAIAIALSQSGMARKSLHGSGVMTMGNLKQGHRKLESCPMGMGRPMVNGKK